MASNPRSRAKDELSMSAIDVDNPQAALVLALGRAVFLWALDPMLLLRPDTGVILDANPAACRALGLSVGDIRDGGRERLRDPDDPRWETALREGARTGRFTGELSHLRGDGTKFPAAVSSSSFDVQGQSYAVVILRDVSEQRVVERRLRDALDELSRVAVTDDLTGLLNRRGFMTTGGQVIAQARRERSPLAVLAADIDGLKQVNDAYGQVVGDTMLRDTADVLTRTLRSADVVARIGGDEFAVILTGTHAATESAVAAQRVRQQLSRHARDLRRPYRLSLSVGMAIATPNTSYDLESLLRSADETLYHAKRHKRARRPAPPPEMPPEEPLT